MTTRNPFCEYPMGNGLRHAFQWIWGRPWHVRFLRYDAPSWRLIYRWQLYLGPLEIRRWTPHGEAMRMIEQRRTADWGMHDDNA